MNSQLLFSEYFDIDPSVLDQHGALNLCIEADLPLFIDPFLLFSSEKPEYQILHDKIVAHLIQLKELATENLNADLTLFQFPEVKQNWLGVCKWGNNGRGLGKKFARNLIKAFHGFYSSFGSENISSSSHIEKLTLVGAGIGRDFISDFTANLMLEYLLEYTESFAKQYLKEDQRQKFSVRCKFDSNLLIWKPRIFLLPFFYKEPDGDFILLTPIDILTKDEAFICHSDFTSQFNRITNSLENSSLRDSINQFFRRNLPKNPKQRDFDRAIDVTVRKFPELLDYYVRLKENEKDKASAVSSEKVAKLQSELLSTIVEFFKHLSSNSAFYSIPPTSYEAALKRANYLKEVIENNDGYRIFYKDGKPIASEDTIQRIFRLTWFASPFDVNSEVNNGRGPADYKISYGNRDSTIVEFKLASSSSLKRNLQNQTEIYKKASRSISDIKVILCYQKADITKVQNTLKILGQENTENIVLIDASKKSSASKT